VCKPRNAFFWGNIDCRRLIYIFLGIIFVCKVYTLEVEMFETAATKLFDRVLCDSSWLAN